MSTPFVGEIRLFGFPRIPTGWLPCDGSLQSIADYQALYALIGTTYGGNGQSTFAMPDLRGRVPLHQGQGPGLSPYTLGQNAGNETVTLTSAQMPQHTHIAHATTGAASTSTPATTLVPGAVASPDTMYSSDMSGAVSFAMASNAVTMAGGSLPHDNTMPTLTVSYCIAFQGIYPTQQ